jgi:hypothetical protein
MTTPSTAESYWVPIAPGDLRRIAGQLRARDVFTPTFVASETDRYDPAIYLQQSARFATSTRLLVDRNLLIRWVTLVRGDEPQEAHRVAAGVMAFAQCAEIDVEPNIALYEGAQRLGENAAHEELLALRFADHIHPGYWADIALRQANEVPLPEAVPTLEADQTIDFSIWLRRWRRNYILSLKLAELELEGGSASGRMSRLMRWMYDDFLLGGPAIALAATYLFPNAERKGLLKGIRSSDRERAIEGVRNAAWDLTLVSEWLTAVEQQKPESCLTSLASLDRSVHFIARSVADVRDADENPGKRMTEVLTELWGEQVGVRLAEEVADYYSAPDALDRRINRPPDGDFISDCIFRGETAVRRWSPVRRNA